VPVVVAVEEEVLLLVVGQVVVPVISGEVVLVQVMFRQLVPHKDIMVERVQHMVQVVEVLVPQVHQVVVVLVENGR
jgi:hypothetical protein